jgi:limonene-1,2-epoxide hydrolase
MFDAWNEHDEARYAKVLDAGCTVEVTSRNCSVPDRLCGREAARAAMRTWLTVFPDLHFFVEGMAASRDRVLTRWLATGTPSRHAGGDRRLAVAGCTVVELRSGTIAHLRSYWDTDEMLRPLRASAQLGRPTAD